jgi:hypothetical protein
MSGAAESAAALLWRQYGDDAVVIATLRAAEVAALGDVEALAHWDEVAAILNGLTDAGTPLN